jgi:L-lactate dehydrogenase complex protein LldF
MTGAHEKQFQETLNDPRLQTAIYAATGRLMSHRKAVVAPEELPDYQELRTQANLVKKHTLENLDHYIEEFETRATARSVKVIYARDGGEVVEFLCELAKKTGARRIVKAKSMTTEEIELNERLEHAGIEAVETDLGEYIQQLAHERPYHIVAPALHKTRFDIADLFSRTLGVERETEIAKQTRIARRVLREKFLSADIGISGANFLVADSGAIVLCTNEGNGRMTTTMPRIQVAIAGIEKLIPRAQDLAVFLKLLGRSATGQPLTVYTSFLAGPRRAGEIDGPEEVYVVLLDNGRTRLLADRDKRESLYCIRCGACLNHCPVYRKVGGHNYPWVYSGPIGAIISPQYLGVTHDPWLPFASSLCGACAEVCPVKIDIPKLLLALRTEVNRAKQRAGQGRLERLGFRVWAWVMRRPRMYEMFGFLASAILGNRESWIRRLPRPFHHGPMADWLSQRDLPPLPDRSFHQLWRARRKAGGS